MDGFKRFLAICFIIFGSLMTIGSIGVTLENPPSEALGTLLFGALFGVGPVTGGIFWLKSIGKKSKMLRARQQEDMLLRLAKRMNGELNVLKVTSNTRLSADEAKIALEDMYKKGLAELNVTDSGSITYEFIDFLDNKQKRLDNPLK